MKWRLAIFLIILSFHVNAQEAVPKDYFSIDITRLTLAMPTIGYEYYFKAKPKSKIVQSLQLGLGYQVHYSNEFGAAGKNSHFGFTRKNESSAYNDDISLGVYQGPVARVGYTFGKITQHKNKPTLMYISPGVSFKYQWYNHAKVYHENRSNSNSEYQYDYRIQSGKAEMIIPQVTAGIKKTLGHFCVDFYGGLQANIKIRQRTVEYWQTSSTNVVPGTPFDENDVNTSPGLTLGIRVGYIRFR